MNIKQAYLAKHDEIIDSITGKLVRVFPLRDQTPAQKKHDIHPQDLEIEDESGQTIKIQLIRQSMHIPATERGKTFRFSSTATERGPDGLRMNIYKPEGKDAVIKLVGSQHCSINVVSGAAAEEPAKQAAPQSGKEAPRKARQTQPDGVEHRVKLYFDVMDEVVRQVEERNPLGTADNDSLGGFSPSDIKEITTGIVMSFKGDYGKYAPAFFNSEAEHNPGSEDPPERAPADKAEPAKKDPGKVINAIITDASTGVLKEKIEKANAAIQSLGLTWVKMYDHLVERLKLLFSQAEIDAAYDSLRAMAQHAAPKMSDEEFCQSLFNDYQTFYEEIQAQSSTNDTIPT